MNLSTYPAPTKKDSYRDKLWLLQTKLNFSELKKVTNLLRLQNSTNLDLQKILQKAITKEERLKDISLSLEAVHQTEKESDDIVTYFELSSLLLKELPFTPALAFQFSGNLHALKRPIIAIIGSRHPTYYGREQAQKFAKSFAQAGCTVLSGGAIGIDAIANSVALEYGASCAIVGSGIKNLYPSSNLRLFQNLKNSARGLILSEFSTYAAAEKWNFPRRNYSIAALADFVLIIEAARTSGSLITANAAADFGIDVGALPGNLNNENSEGTNTLIKNGAYCIRCPEDVLECIR